MERECICCNKVKSTNQFRDRRSKCRQCESFLRAVSRENNRDREKQYHKNYRQVNKKRIQRQIAERKSADPLFHFTRQLRVSINLAITKYNYEKCRSTKEILGCDKQTLVSHLESKFTQGMSWNNYGEWHIDHIIPLAKAKTKEEIIKLNHFTNLQPLWAIDNLKKGAKQNGSAY